MASYARSLGYKREAIEMVRELVEHYKTDTVDLEDWAGQDNQVWADLKRMTFSFAKWADGSLQQETGVDGVTLANRAASGDADAEYELTRVFCKNQK